MKQFKYLWLGIIGLAILAGCNGSNSSQIITPSGSSSMIATPNQVTLKTVPNKEVDATIYLSESGTLTVTYTGVASHTVAQIQIDDTQCKLNPQLTKSCPVVLKYTPTSNESGSGTIVFVGSDAQGNPDQAVVNVSYNSSPAQLIVTPNSVNAVTKPGHAVQYRVTLSNPGAVAINYQNASESLATTSFNVDDSACQGKTLISGSSCAVKLIYNPPSTQLESGSGTVSFTAQDANSKQYLADVAVSYLSESSASPVPGWPDYLAMGSITRNISSESVANLDAAFTYYGSGDSGENDPYRLQHPRNLINMIATTINNMQHQGNIQNINPTIVEYVMNASLSNSAIHDNVTEFTNLDYLGKHFFNLGYMAKLLNNNAGPNIAPGTIILNPDLLSSISTSDNLQFLQQQIIPVESAVNIAQHILEDSFDYTQTAGTAAASYCYSESTTGLLPSGTIFQLYDAMLPILYQDDSYVAVNNCIGLWIYNQAAQKANIKVDPDRPTFTNDIKGWAQAQNYLAKHYAPQAALGWQMNLWGGAGSGWVYDKNQPQEITNYVTSQMTVLNAIGVFDASSLYNPDFLAVDRYGSDDYVESMQSNLRQNTVYNDNNWDNILSMVKQLSEALSSYTTNNQPVPIMLWQISAAHIPVIGDIVSMNTEGAAVNYFFGDSSLQQDLTNVSPWFVGIGPLGAGYGDCTGVTALNCLKKNSFNWATETTTQLQSAVNSHVFAILWGAATVTFNQEGAAIPMMTSVWLIPGNPDSTIDDGGHIKAVLADYYTHPQPLINNSVKK